MFEESVKDIVEGVVNEVNCSVFTDGATGAGEGGRGREREGEGGRGREREREREREGGSVGEWEGGKEEGWEGGWNADSVAVVTSVEL